jgi:hypothetical protein
MAVKRKPTTAKLIQAILLILYLRDGKARVGDVTASDMGGSFERTLYAIGVCFQINHDAGGLSQSVHVASARDFESERFKW